MMVRGTTRVALLAAMTLLGGVAVRAQQQAPAPIERRAPSNTPHVVGPAPLPGQPGTGGGAMRGMHLNQWMGAHQNLSPQQRQQALEREPGFRDLPPTTQQRMRARLNELESMPPPQRQRMMDRAEQMERLDPNQRADVRGAMLQLSSLPPEQRRMVSHAFRELRGIPPQERANALNSGRFNYLTGPQRMTLDRLMQVEPMLPPQGR